MNNKCGNSNLYKQCVEILEFPVIGNVEYGYLVAIENHKHIPFDIKRAYYIYEVLPDTSRGYHAHKNLKQVLIAISGSIKVTCEFADKKEIFELNTPYKGLYISGVVWRTIWDFSPGAILMVLADDYYNEEDYIRNYDDFLQENKKCQ